jgi:hypothetical protein
MERYVLLMMSFEMARDQARDLELGLLVVGDLDRQFDVNRSKLQANLLDVLIVAAKDPARCVGFAERALSLSEAEFKAERPDGAALLVEQASRAAKKAAHPKLEERVRHHQEEVVEVVQWVVDYRKAAEKLKQNGNDPQAHRVVGRYLCLINNDWARGLPHLACGDDLAFKYAALLELDQVKEPLQKQRLAEWWMDLAAREQGQARANLERHAHPEPPTVQFEGKWRAAWTGSGMLKLEIMANGSVSGSLQKKADGPVIPVTGSLDRNTDLLHLDFTEETLPCNIFCTITTQNDGTLAALCRVFKDGRLQTTLPLHLTK